MSKFFEGLNEKQLEAVKHVKGPLLVLAGAGSGKTRALTHRIAYLIKECGVNPWQILAVTFTNKAANEMKERIMNLLGVNPAKNEFAARFDIPTIGTFHSICVRILRKHIHLLGFENNFVIYDSADQLILMKRILKELHIDEKQFNPRAILSHISNAKNQLIGPEQYHKHAHSFFTEKVDQVFSHYQKALTMNGALDFDDIIMKMVELFKTHPDILDEYQEKFLYISVDEYQDTNTAQYTLVNMLAEKYRNICVIGDDDQSIYSWRGANIKNILDFEKDYSEAKIIKLEQNYRSTQNILDAAHNVIVKNKNRKEKKLWTSQEAGKKIHVVTCNNERHEGEFIAQNIVNEIRSHETPSYKDFVVLYRTNAQSRVIEEVFLRYGIPYQIVGGTKFYERKEIKDMLAYLRLLQNPADSVSLHRVINVPPRKIGAKTLEHIQALAQHTNSSFFAALANASAAGNDLNQGKIELCEKFVDLIRKLQRVNKEEVASGLIKFVLEWTGYKKFLDDGSVEGESRLENIYELISVASKYDKLEPGVSLSVFLEEISLLSDVDQHNSGNNVVTLMTVHSAKGLEFPHVFLAGMEEGIFPHSRSSLDQKEMEEERRLMYVAVTRAKEKLYLLHAEQRLLYGESKYNAASQFLSDMPSHLVDFWPPKQEKSTVMRSAKGLGDKPIPVELNENTVDFKDGDKVFHESFGNGIVVSIQGGVATVAFENPSVGIKKLATSIAPLKKL